jgi:hypothetical protein
VGVLKVIFVGSLDVFDEAVAIAGVAPATRVCVLATAAAFQGAREAIERVRALLAPSGATIIGVEAISRASANDLAVVESVTSADLVVLVDGAVLHARSVWRGSELGAALASVRLLAIGSVGSVLGETMIDPRGGAPTTGLGLFDDVVLSVPAGAEQTERTRGLLGRELILVELGPRSVVTFEGTWRVVARDDLIVTRAGEPTSL